MKSSVGIVSVSVRSGLNMNFVNLNFRAKIYISPNLILTFYKAGLNTHFVILNFRAKIYVSPNLISTFYRDPD